MLLLDAASKLQLTLSAVGSIDYIVSKIRNASPQTPVPTKGNATTVAATDLCAVPGGTDVDTVECITLCNVHATQAEDVTVNHVGGTTVRVFKVVGLLPGEYCVWNENGTLFVYASNGALKAAQAIPSTRTTLISGAGSTYTVPAGCRAIDVECYGGGGAGGGATSVASSGGGGGGGGSGGYTRKLFSPPSATYTYTVGGGGAGASGAVGGSGADTTFGTLTAKGGTGGAFAASAVATRALGGAGGIAGSGGDENAPGSPGSVGLNTTAALVASGAGGSSEAGGGGNGVTAQGAGVAAVANTGAGGSGGASVSAGAAVAGGAGGSGVIVITEYY
jgi:hypothetical protein